jgi:hypothetical protein
MPKPSAAQLALFEGKSWWPQEWVGRAAPAPPPPQPAAEVVEAFKDWRPAPEPTPVADNDDDEKLPDPAVFATRLLRTLAESPLVVASVRVMARRYLKKLRQSGTAPDEPEDEDEDEDDPEDDENFRPVPAPAF